ncbi:hypothetical protein J5X98_26990 [Leptothermofonsia sichuanensis E412]|uniref:hypothetical protein n=1 Tax=Leptothermofonsia sichuanensis TaxID=2917832 RepID=UPI001CA7ABC3|nr:hypothetical protein [Leptothermofonsia sichuanensis]QZZ20810.1 hypothetical protein J5X98_26990 [Leptothermofonsia sichuanensis E412]
MLIIASNWENSDRLLHSLTIETLFHRNPDSSLQPSLDGWMKHSVGSGRDRSLSLLPVGLPTCPNPASRNV